MTTVSYKMFDFASHHHLYFIKQSGYCGNMKFDYDNLPVCPQCSYSWVPRCATSKRCPSRSCRLPLPFVVEWQPHGWKKCSKCGEIKQHTDALFYRNSAGSLRPDCKECNKAKVHQWTRTHRAKVKETSKAYYEKMIAEMGEEGFRLYQRANAKRVNSRLKMQMLEAYGHDCACCGETEIAFLTLDHINGGGVKHRESVSSVYRDLRNQGWPKDGYRILCMNCNFATRRGAPCPHAISRQSTSSLS